MTFAHSKIDKLLQLLSSSDDENLDDDEPISENEWDNISAGKSKQLFKRNNETEDTTTDQIKIVHLEKNPITIGDSDSDSSQKSNFFDTCNKAVSEAEVFSEESEDFQLFAKNSKTRKKRNKKSDNIADIAASNAVNEINNKNKRMYSIRTQKNRPRIDRNLLCKVCNQRLKNEQLFMLHMQIHDNRKETECVVCNVNFENVDAVLKHYATFDFIKKTNIDKIKDEHYIRFRPFPCQLCDLRYKNRKHLNDHLEIHANEKKFLCAICGRRFRKEFNLRNHLKKIHEKTAQFLCEPCNQKFRNIRELNTHQRRVHGELNLVCPVCNRAFMRLDNMKQHLKTHSRVYRQCHICKINIKFQRDYNKHMREVHNQLENYTCYICKRDYLVHSRLVKHLQSHSRIKDKCSVCNKEFRNRRDHNAHMRNMHGVIIAVSEKNEENIE